MNKSILFGLSLLSLISLPAFSETMTAPSQTPSDTTQTPPDEGQPAGNNPSMVKEASAPTAAPAETPVTNPTPNTPTPTTTMIVDCNYHIPATTTNVDNNLINQWAEKAAQQTFNLEASLLDSQLAGLKNCYTDQGWQSFNDALSKSGNLDAIKKENLTVSSMIDGQSNLVSLKDNQWKVTVPLQVVYQNGKEKIVQSLTINLVISRKVSGDLGIIQIIATPRQAINNTANVPVSTTPETSNAAATPAPTATAPTNAPNATTSEAETGAGAPENAAAPASTTLPPSTEGVKTIPGTAVPVPEPSKPQTEEPETTKSVKQ